MWQQKLQHANISKVLIEALEGYSFKDVLDALAETRALITENIEKISLLFQASEKVSLNEECKKTLTGFLM